jgi:hypothetical protein
MALDSCPQGKRGREGWTRLPTREEEGGDTGRDDGVEVAQGRARDLEEPRADAISLHTHPTAKPDDLSSTYDMPLHPSELRSRPQPGTEDQIQPPTAALLLTCSFSTKTSASEAEARWPSVSTEL